MLDNIKTYKKYDHSDIGSGIEKMSEQLRIAFSDTTGSKVPQAYKDCDTIVVAGMGGSSLGAHIVQSAFAKFVKKPIILVRGYDLPAFVNSKTLIVLSSFSGTTEEVVSVAEQAKLKKAKVVTITSGGELLLVAKRNKWPSYVFKPGDLAKEPRLGTGFMMIGFLGILESCGFVKVSKKQKENAIGAMIEVVDSCALDVPISDNPAKQVALAIKDRSVFIVASEHLTGSAHTFSNQINETAKQFAQYLEIPELNHHLMEGLSYPKGLFNKFSVLMIKSKFYSTKVQKRYNITAQIFEKLGGQVVEYEARGKDIFEEACEVLQFGALTSYYLGILNKVDPRRIPFVDWFKSEMKK
jgi:glucose/mannose-6-phosphate isomerase